MANDGLLFQGKKMLDEQYQPDGYNIGVNCGRASGQTVFHVHEHLIPRYDGIWRIRVVGLEGLYLRSKCINPKNFINK